MGSISSRFLLRAGSIQPTEASGPTGLFVLLSFCNFAVGVGAFSIIGLLEPLAQGLAVDVAQVGLLLTAYAAAFALCAPILASVTGGLGRRRVLSLGLALCGTASLAAAFAPGFGWLFPLRALAAVGAGMVTPISLAIAVALAPEARRGRALSTVFLGISFSQVVGVPVSAWLGYELGWRPAFALIGLLALACMALVWLRVPSGLRLTPVGLADLRRAVLDGVVLLTVGFTVVFICALYVVYTYLSPILTQSMGFGAGGVATTLFLFGVAAPLGNRLGGLMADSIGAVPGLVLVCLAEIALLPMFGLLPFAVAAFMTFVFVWSLVGAMFSAGQQLRLVALDPERGTVLLSLHAASIYVGTAAGSALGSLVLNGWGVEALGPVAGCLAFAALGVLLWSHRAAMLRAG